MIHCNKCKYNFEPKVRTRYIEKDVEEVFFNCPKCHERYIAYYLNDSIKKKQNRLRNLKGSSALKKMLTTQIEKEMNILEKQLDTQ